MIGIGLRVAVVSAALVIAIVLLVVGYVLWQLTPGQLHETPGPTDVHITLDTVDLSIAVLGVGGLAIALAGIAAWVIARRAVLPIAEAARMQRTFVADASHELRTPLTVLHARVQRLRMMTPADDARRAVVDELQGDTRVLIDIVNDLLDAAAGSEATGGVADLDVALITLERDMSVLAAERQVHLTVGRAEPGRAGPVLAVSETQLRRCLVALTDNAIGHTRPDGNVSVRVRADGPSVTIRVGDDGPGITGIAPTRVFDRFAHGTPTATAGAAGTRTGYGIGLALVRDIAVRAGGDVTVERTGSDGTVFALRLPVVQPDGPGHEREDR
ncbi:signal transduction histidine kinase [Curtobacterium flaccumfaciens]|uniref:histidine kinase n=1 Tax=Curtobacterium salicis TaxID=1779862 RepID=A0ABX0TA97_9MICO|nr:signal transduction histidine kinase [Curtobacterium sp. WW7]